MKLLRDTCRSIRDLLPLHVGGDLDAGQARRVDGHLHACLSCFREYRELATMRGRLGVLAEQPLPAGALDDFTEQVMARIAQGEEGPAAELPGVRARRLGPVRPLAAAAALVVALSVGLALGSRWSQAAPSDTGPAPLVGATDAPAWDDVPVQGPSRPDAAWPVADGPAWPATLPQLGVPVGDFRTAAPDAAAARVGVATGGVRVRLRPFVLEPGLPTISSRDRQLMQALPVTLRPMLLNRSLGGLEPDLDAAAAPRPRNPALTPEGEP